MERSVAKSGVPLQSSTKGAQPLALFGLHSVSASEHQSPLMLAGPRLMALVRLYIRACTW